MKVVTAYRPFEPESIEHHRLGAFDWHGAIEMLRESVRRSCRCETHVITDVDHVPPGPAYQYPTTERRLMLWILDAMLCYLRSDDFDDDTVYISPDILVFEGLRPYFVADLGLVVRTGEKFAAKPEKQVLNSAQWWRWSAKARLIDFYERALAIAKTLPEERLIWGADTDPIVALISPVASGLQLRSGLSVYGHEITTVMTAFGERDKVALERGEVPAEPYLPLLDFKYWRKQHMRAYFTAVFGQAV